MQTAEDDEALARSRPGSRTQAQEMQRKRILDAAVGEVGERGLRHATVAGVSARAGVSRSTFYEFFEDLEACVRVVLRQVVSRSTILMSDAFRREAHWQDGVLAALAALLVSLDRQPLLARVCLVEALAGSPGVLQHRARELAALNPLVDVGREQARAHGAPPELTAEGSVASVAGILHARLVTGEAPPFVSLLGQLVGLVVAPYLDPGEVVRAIKRGEDLERTILEERASSSSLAPATVQIPAALRHPSAHRARSCVIFLAANPGASNAAVAAGIGVSHLSQVSELLSRLQAAGLLTKQSGGAGRPNAWWLTPHGEQYAQAHRIRGPHIIGLPWWRQHSSIATYDSHT
jgi:AcrR family transcriptional regulator